MDKSAAAADDVERGDYEQGHERTGACASSSPSSPCFGRFLHRPGSVKGLCGSGGGLLNLSFLLAPGTVWTATAHIVTAVIGSGVLALAWSVAQLGWVAGPLALAGFACVTYYTSTLLANAYRAPHPVTGDRNRTYMDAVRSYLSTTILLTFHFSARTQQVHLYLFVPSFY